MIRDAFYLCHKKHTRLENCHHMIQYIQLISLTDILLWLTRLYTVCIKSICFIITWLGSTQIIIKKTHMLQSRWVNIHTATRHQKNHKHTQCTHTHKSLKALLIKRLPSEINSVHVFPDHCYDRNVTAEDNMCFMTGTWPDRTVHTWEHGTYARLLQILIRHWSECRTQRCPTVNVNCGNTSW